MEAAAGGFDTQMPCDHLSSSTPTDRGELGQIFFSCFYNPQTLKALTQLSSSFRFLSSSSLEVATAKLATSLSLTNPSPQDTLLHPSPLQLCFHSHSVSFYPINSSQLTSSHSQASLTQPSPRLETSPTSPTHPHTFPSLPHYTPHPLIFS